MPTKIRPMSAIPATLDPKCMHCENTMPRVAVIHPSVEQPGLTAFLLSPVR
jgi:hypothetical protein